MSLKGRTVEERKAAVEKCLQTMVHASLCKIDNCVFAGCKKMKKVAQHTKTCSRKRRGCLICVQMMGMVCYHSKYCKDPMCLVPLCDDIKNNLMIQMKMKQADMLKHYKPLVKHDD